MVCESLIKLTQTCSFLNSFKSDVIVCKQCNCSLALPDPLSISIQYEQPNPALYGPTELAQTLAYEILRVFH